MVGKIKIERKNTTVNAGEAIIVDTCSIINGEKFEFLFSRLNCLATKETFKEFLRVTKKKLNNSCFKILEDNTEVKKEAKRLYLKYGLVWGVSYVDCLNLAWAKINGKPLMTCDRALLKVAQKEGVEIIPMLPYGRQKISVVLSKTICENVSFKESTHLTKPKELNEETLQEERKAFAVSEVEVVAEC
jgi:hypothetical protein